MTISDNRTATVTVYASGNQLYTKGNGFSLEFRCLIQDPPVFEVENNWLRIDANETTASLLAPFAFQSADAELVAEDVELTLFIKNGEIKFVRGYYSTLPIYSPYHAMTDEGDLYEIEGVIAIPEDPTVEGDELLNIPDRNEACNTVRNMEKEWAGPVANDRLQEWFDTGRLHAAIPVES